MLPRKSRHGNIFALLSLVALLLTATTPARKFVSAQSGVTNDPPSLTNALSTSGTVAADQVTQVKKVVPSDGEANQLFGLSTDISGTTMVVANLFATGEKGAAYVYERDLGGPNNWGEVKKLKPAGSIGSFWASISGDTIVIGCPLQDAERGYAYVYERNAGGPGNWGLTKQLIDPEGATADRFGIEVAVEGDRIVVTAGGDDPGGSAHVFERNRGGTNNWGRVKKLTAVEATMGQEFGSGLAISGDRIAVGADRDDARSGSVYIFERNRGGIDNWGQVKKIKAGDAAVDAFFGIGVDIEGDTLVVGAEHGTDTGLRGAVYVFYRNRGGADNWGEAKKVSSPAGTTTDRFGLNVSISGNLIVTGAQREDSQRGAAYVFERHKGGTDNWGLFSKVTATDGVANDFYGGAVWIGTSSLVIGCTGDDAGRGSAYVYRLYPEAVNVSAATFQKTPLAPQMIAAVFGADLSNGTAAGGSPLPTTLLGTSVSVTDSLGSTRSAQLFFVSQTQVNYFVPPGTSLGLAVVRVTSGSGQVSLGEVVIEQLSPGLFTADSTGKEIAAAQVLRVRGSQQTYEDISRFDLVTNSIVPIPIDLGPEGDQVYLIMYGTGFRFRSSEGNVSVKVGGRTLQSLFSGATGSFVGLDQLNVSPLPRDLAGAGVINVEVSFDGRAANLVKVAMK